MSALDQLRSLAKTATPRTIDMIDDAKSLSGYVEWLHGAECPWVEESPDHYVNTATGERLMWHIGERFGVVSEGDEL